MEPSTQPVPSADAVSAESLTAWLDESLALTQDLVGDLVGSPRAQAHLPIVNPTRWEVAHVAWFHERWFLREAYEDPVAPRDDDPLYDSMRLVHERRWCTVLPELGPALARLGATQDALRARVQDALGDRRRLRLLLLCVYHQDMHNEAFAYTRQTHGWPATPALVAAEEGGARRAAPSPRVLGDLQHPGGELEVGACAGRSFAFDNEEPAHRVRIAPFALARRAVTVGEYAAFVEAGGYQELGAWDEAGRAFLARTGAGLPCYWRRDEHGALEERRFDRWLPLERAAPMVHVSWHEARAYARFVGRRLPGEFEWEVAARAEPEAFLTTRVWEWTEDPFLPYAGFETSAYPDYSLPWFGSRRVLRGGGWLTPPRMRWASLRNFFEPHRRDVWCGFRTAAAR